MTLSLPEGCQAASGCVLELAHDPCKPRQGLPACLGHPCSAKAHALSCNNQDSFQVRRQWRLLTGPPLPGGARSLLPTHLAFLCFVVSDLAGCCAVPDVLARRNGETHANKLASWFLDFLFDNLITIPIRGPSSLPPAPSPCCPPQETQKVRSPAS